MDHARRFGIPAFGFSSVDKSRKSASFDQAVGAHGLQDDGGGSRDVFMNKVVLTIVVDEASRIDICACRRTNDGFVFRLEGPFGIGGRCDTDTASHIGFGTGDDGGVVHDEMAFGRLDYVGGPDGSVFAFGGPGTDVWEGGLW